MRIKTLFEDLQTRENIKFSMDHLQMGFDKLYTYINNKL